MSKNGKWPIYNAPYGGGGLVIGWLQFGSTVSEGFRGQCVSAKPASFICGVTVSGSRDQAPSH
jgi:hypothetical protein